jgi:hypothetical protein
LLPHGRGDDACDIRMKVTGWLGPYTPKKPLKLLILCKRGVLAVFALGAKCAVE